MSHDEKTPLGAPPINMPSTPPPALHKLQTSQTNSSSLAPHVHSPSGSTPIDSETTPRPSLHEVNSSNPFSAFYSHPDLRRSLDGSRSNLGKDASKTNLNINIKDLEAQTPLSNATSRTQMSGKSPKVSVDGRVKECTVWPSKTTLREKALLAKKHGPIKTRWNRLSKKQRLWIKILIAMLIIGAAVGIGVGITKAVGGGVFASQGNSKQIPDVNNNSAGSS